MRVTKINVSPNFGYNAQYHKELQAKLNSRKDLPLVAKKLVEMDNLLLGIEDDIVELEKNKRNTKTDRYDYLTDVLINFRSSFARSIESVFPRLKYCEDASKDYAAEAELPKMNENMQLWRQCLASEIEQYTLIKQEDLDKVLQSSKKSSDEPKKAEGNIIPTAVLIQPPIQPQTTQTAQAAKANDKEDNAEVVSKFIPSDSSPKGFADVVDMDDLKEKFKSDIIEYANNPELEALDFEEYGIKAPHGYLFYGPPGCGKTYIIEALAAESGLEMYKMDLSKFGSRFINQTQKNIQKAFDQLAQEHQKTGKKILLFMDEFDSVASKRRYSETGSREDDKAVNALLKCIDSARDNGIIIIAATNRYDGLDAAIKSRFDYEKFVGLPSKKSIASLVAFELRKSGKKGESLANNKEEIEKIAEKLVGYSNRSVSFIMDSARRIAKNDNRSEIKPEHVLKAIEEKDFEKTNNSEYQKNASKQKSILGFGTF